MTKPVRLPLDIIPVLVETVIHSSQEPLILLDAELNILVASASFGRLAGVDHTDDGPLSALGAGEWDIPQLQALLLACSSGGVAVEDYELTLARPGRSVRNLLVNAHKLVQIPDPRPMVLLSITDVTAARSLDRQKDILVREKAVLLEELQHRVANSLQIIASVLLQSAKRVQSDETRTHIYDAHHRVMSVAALQHQLAITATEDVELHLYFTNLCRSIGASMIRDRSTMSVDVEVKDCWVKANDSLSLGLIVTELVINSLKHAFPGQRGGKITVRYTAKDGEWQLSVRDNGVGMPMDGKDAKPGLGTNIVRALAMQLDAEILAKPGYPGTIITLTHKVAIEGGVQLEVEAV